MQKIIKYTGVLLIILFSVISVYSALIYRSIPEGNFFKSTFAYTVFFEDRFFDFRMNKTLNKEVQDPRIVLADIDDYSIKSLDSWPIDRKHWATLVRKLKTYGAKIIAFDVFFGEQSKTCNGYNPDDDIAKAIEEFHEIPNNRVILPYNLEVYGQENLKSVPEDLYVLSLSANAPEGGAKLSSSEISNSVYPFQKLIDTEVSLGFIQMKPDRDGIVRHYKAVTKAYDEIYVQSLSLMAYQHYSGELDESEDDMSLEMASSVEEDEGPKTMLDLTTTEEAKLVTNKGILHLNIYGETKIRWTGDGTTFPRASIYDIMTKADDDQKMIDLFKDTIVFVGSTAYGAYDLRHTPVDPMLPGVYVHMHFFKMLLDGYLWREITDSVYMTWAILLLSIAVLLLVQMKGNPILDLVTVTALVVAIYYYDVHVLIPGGYETRLFFTFFAIIGCYSWITFLHFHSANEDKVFLKSAFGSYISPELIDEMYSKGQAPALGGESGIRTAYFTDIQSFSTFSEKLSATELVELLNEYLTVMTDILLEEGGTLDKYEGDAIIAFFGAPMPLEDHAERACMVAHRMQEALVLLRDKWTKEGDKWPQIVHEMRMRIGINSGEIVTGNMGSKSRMNYTMMGDSVNLAARLEESAKQYGIFTQVSMETKQLAGDKFLWRELDTIKVVGKSIPVTTYDLLGLKETAQDFLHELASKFKKGIEYYKMQKWDEALAIFEETKLLEYVRFPSLEGKKTNPSEIYIERCLEYKKNPPSADWDGVYTLTSK
jgi:adenylate cyclase